MDTLPTELHLLLISFITRIQDGCNFSSTCHYYRNLYCNDLLDEKKRIVVDAGVCSNWGMREAALGGHADLVRFFVEKGATLWNESMISAAFGGYVDLVRFFADKGAANWDLCMIAAAHGGHADLVRFFVEKGATKRKMWI